MVPTQDLIDQEFARQEQENVRKFLARQAGQIPADRREAAVELAMLTAGPVAPPPGGWTSGVVDVNRAPLRPPAPPEKHVQKNEAYCKYCGKMFKAKTLGAAKMSKGRHEKKEHAGQSCTAA